MTLHIVILAAGQGKRMHSATPKILHQIAGKSMVRWVYETASRLNADCIHIIYGHEGEQVQAALKDLDLHWILQEAQLGTGHAIKQAIPFIPDEATVLILSADVPLIQIATLNNLLACGGNLALLTAIVDEPTGLGRIIRDKQGSILHIREEKDANASERQIKEIYSGICCVSATDLKRWLPKLSANNAQSEYYLTDVIEMAAEEGQLLPSVLVKDLYEIQGVNNRLQLQVLERIWQKKQAERYLLEGVQIVDAARFDLRGELYCGKDVYIDVNCIFEGRVEIGDGCYIGPNCVLRDVVIQDGTEIYANSLLEGAMLGKQCKIGPFARLRPGTKLGDFCKIGNFVETKKAVMGQDSKASHLSYLGDVTIGKSVNIGAGTITCNYDGESKYETIIEDEVFIGSGTCLIAPVRIGANATIGAGALIRKNAPSAALTISDNKQRSILGWNKRKKLPAF